MPFDVVARRWVMRVRPVERTARKRAIVGDDVEEQSGCEPSQSRVPGGKDAGVHLPMAEWRFLGRECSE